MILKEEKFVEVFMVITFMIRLIYLSLMVHSQQMYNEVEQIFFFHSDSKQRMIAVDFFLQSFHPFTRSIAEITQYICKNSRKPE